MQHTKILRETLQEDKMQHTKILRVFKKPNALNKI